MNKFEIVDRFFQGDISAMPNLPKRATANAAGYDFEVAEDTIVPPYVRQMEKLPYSSGPLTLDEVAAETKRTKAKPTLVPTGIKCKLDNNCYLELTVRSSLPLKHWLILANGAGIIDADYYENEDNDGEIFFQLINLSPYPILLKAGDRIGQGIIKHYGLVDGDSYDQGAKRRGGFGSTSAPSNTNVITTPYISKELNSNEKPYSLNTPIFYDNNDPLNFNANDIVYTTTTTASIDDTYTVANSIPVDPNAVWCLNSELPDIKSENGFQQLSFDDLEKLKDSLV